MLALCFLAYCSSGFIVPNNGWGGTVNLNSYPDSVCSVSGVTQTLLNKCAITCSGTSTTLVKIISSKGNSSQLYYCVTKPTLTSVDKTTLYASTPYNLTLTGTNFYNKTSLCALGTSTFSTVFVNSLNMLCVYTSIKAGAYTFTLLPNSVDSIGSISITVLNSYRFGSVYALNPYVPTSISVLGSRLDSSILCNFTGSTTTVKVTVISSSNVTCAVPSGLVGNLTVLMQSSTGMVLSSQFYLMTYNKISLLLAGPYPCTGNTLEIEYTGSIVEGIFCTISTVNYPASFNSEYISCLISGLSEGDYTVYISDGSVQISANTITFSRRLDSISASFQENSGNVLVSVDSTLLVPQLYCKWGYNYGVLTTSVGSNFNCPTLTIKDKGDWCVELSYDGFTFTNTCQYVHTVTRTSNFIGISPQVILIDGGEIQVDSNMLYDDSYSCLIDGYTITAVLDTGFITCLVPQLSAAVEYPLIIQQGIVTVATVTLNAVVYVIITANSPPYFTTATKTILLTGEGFYSGMSCYFNESPGDCTYLNDTSISCALPTSVSNIPMYCLNIDNTPSLIYTIPFRTLPIISNSLPSILFEGIYNLLYLQGTTFYESSSIKITCDSDYIFDAKYIDSSLLSLSTLMDYCSLGSSISLSVSPNFQDYSESFALTISPIPNLSALSFYSSPYFGGDVLTFYGNGFVGNLYCSFGGVLAETQITSYEEGNCTVPYHSIGSVDFALMLEGLDYPGNIVKYAFDDLIAFTLSPSKGSSLGGTIVTLVGDFSTISSDSVCLFGGIETPATGSVNLYCTAPSGQGQVPVTVVAGGKLYSTYIPVYFTYVAYPTINSASPTSSPSLGNSTIIISGTGFTTVYHWQCAFGSLYTEAIYLGPTSILCYSPSQAPMSTSISVSMNSADFSDSVPFTYTPDIAITSFTPSIGPSTGSTTVTISGKNISYAIYCKIGLLISTGITTSTGIQCLTPGWWYGPKAIEISSNKIDFTRSGVLFNFYSDMQITSIWPRSVPNTGSSVIISGVNFPPGLSCRIGLIQNPVTYVGNNLNCTIPATTVVSVELTANSQTANYISFAEVTTLSTYSAPVFTSVSQQFGVVSTYFKLTATGLLNTTAFGTFLGNQTYYRSITSTSAILKVPNQISGVYSLKVSNNGQDLTTLTSLTVSDVVQVIRVAPILASILGGTVFNVKVFNAVSTSFLTCRFIMDYEVALGLYKSYIVSATYYNSTHVTCTSPALSYPGTAFLSISNDNQTFSSSNTTIYFIDTCKNRVSCSGNSIQACSTGTYCPETYWYSPPSCPQGYYQNLTLQTGCVLCPLGQICTSPIIPSSCSSNYTCSELGLVYPNRLCDKGYYCNTNTSIPTQLCARGNYCDGLNFTCMDGFICNNGSSTYYGESACPEGFYCVGDSITVCPTRHYCSQQSSTFPVPCPAGTYNPFFAQQQCIACPLGFVCPSIKMLYPLSCPPGYICDVEGLTYPVKLCTPGYYCPGGVATAFTQSPCYVITPTQALDSSVCVYDILLRENNPENLSGNTTNFNFTQVNLCCWNTTITAAFVAGLSNGTSFQEAANMFIQDGYIGFDLYTPVLTSRRALLDVPSFFPDISDQDLFNFYLTQLLYMDRPSICKSGVFCLEGAATDEVDPTLVRVGKLCNSGTYCPEGSSTPAGQLCPAGYHCPPGSSTPLENAPGTSTGFSGNVIAGPCAPNYFSNSNASFFCYNCPNGYECTQPTTIWPAVCLLGDYRNYQASSICSNCPLSSFSYDFGVMSEKECLACDEGRMCLLAGTSNVSLSSPCLQGDYCEEAADISSHKKCPPGFLCGDGTSPTTRYDVPCIEGFYCPLGTKYLNKYLYPCPENCYCPPATYDYSMFYANPATSNATSVDTPPTICPLGTGKVSEGSRTNLLMCETLNGYAEANPILEVNPIIPEISANFTVYKDNTTGIESYVFHLESRELALVTLDLLHVSGDILQYGVDWAVGFTIQDSITDTTLQPVPMPQSFLRTDVSKTVAVLEFSVLAWTALDFKVSILLYNGLYHTYGNLFVNTTSVEIFVASRNLVGTRDTFLAMIDNTIALPFNIPSLDPIQSFYMLGYSPSPPRANLERVEKINEGNWFQPNTRYWGSNTQLFLPYLPYFSNCKGYGQYIPLWAPLELSPECELIDPANTKPVVPFAFGSSPVADSCINVTIECIYDELIGDSQAVPRWFEQPLALLPIFYITQEVVNDDDFISQGVTSAPIPVLTFNIVPSGQLPTVVQLQILYQQFDQYTKKIILIYVTFLNTISLSPEQQSGLAQTPYNLTIIWRAMNQKELLVNFVFDFSFYTSLFILIGVIGMIFAAILWVHHWLFTSISPPPKFAFFSYFRILVWSPFEGYILAATPIFAVLVLNSLLMTGYLLGQIYFIGGDQAYINNGIFDSFFASYKDFNSLDPTNVQRARLGISLIACGTYISWLGSTIFIPSKRSEPSEEPKGNLWAYVRWKRFNHMFVTMVAIGQLIGLVQLSYSLIFALNSFIFVAVLFFVAVILEYFCALMLDDEILIETINQSTGIVTGIATFGASDFVVFLIGYFVGLMILLSVRLYVDHVKDFLFDLTDEWIDKYYGFMDSLSDAETYKSLFSRRVTNINSVEDYDDEEDFVLESPQEEQVLESYDSDHEEVEEENSYYTYEDILPSPVGAEEPSEELGEQEIEELLGVIVGYSGDLLGYFFNTVLIIVCWNYYDFLPLFSMYGVPKASVWLYVVFSAVTIPLQIGADIFLHNANELYNGWAVHDFLDLMRQKYIHRKTRWIDDDPQREDIIEDGMRQVYRLCLSPHFYFMSTIFNFGVSFVSFGFATVLNNTEYNMFDDRATIPIVLFSVAMCFVIHKAAVIVGNLLKIWVVKDGEEPEEEPVESEVDIVELYNELYNPEVQEKVVPDISNWDMIEIVKADDEVIRRELLTDRITDPVIREKFLLVNKQWVQENLEEIFRDENFADYRGIMLSKLAKMYGYLSKSTENRNFLQLEDENKEKIESPAVVGIAKYWLARAQRNRTLYLQAASVIESKLEEYCMYCGSLYALQCEIFENIEDLFLAFKKRSNPNERLKMFMWDISRWRKYLSRFAHFRTLCVECIQKCEEFNIHCAEIHPRAEACNDESAREQLIPETAKKIIRKWLELSRSRYGS